MQEFMLLIRNAADHVHDMTPDTHLEFVNKCRDYIGELKQEGRLIGAQPMVRDGTMVARVNGDWLLGQFTVSEEAIAGYYHVRANDIDEAVAIAKRNPEFIYSTAARIEVRPLKTQEQQTGFVYPNRV